MVVFFYMIAWGALDPFLTIYFYDLFGDYTSVAAISALLYFFSMLLSLPLGDLADIVSKKKLMRIFLIFYLPFGFILASLSTFLQFALFRIYHAILAAGLWSSAESFLRMHSPQHKTSESMGLFEAAVSSALVVGAVIGGTLMTLFGIKSLFYVFFIFPALALFVLPTLPNHHGTSNLFVGIKQLKNKKIFRFELQDYFQIPGLLKISLLAFIARSVSFGLPVVLPLFSDIIGANYFQIGLIFAVFALPAVFEAPFSVLAEKIDRKKILAFGGAVSILTLLMAYWSGGVFSLFALTLFIALAFAFINPTIEGAVTDLMPRRKVGELNGVYRSIVLLAASIGSFIIGPVADNFSIQAPFLVGAGLMAVFVALVLLFKLPETAKSA